MIRKLNNTYKKINSDKKISVVFFGGSVTAGTGATDPKNTCWRAITGRYLKEKYPSADIKLTNAAIGGTGTGYGMLRMERDVLPAKPDLVFIDFTINDSYQRYTVQESLVYYESILQKLYKSNPYIDIVMTFITDRGVLENGSRFIDAHKQLAEHYGIPTIDFADALKRELDITGNSPDVYLTDWAHPNDRGYDLYSRVAISFLENELSTLHEEPMPVSLPKSYSNNLITGEAKIVSTTDINAQLNGFTRSDGDFGAKNAYHCYIEGDEMTFKFSGSYIGVHAQSYKDDDATDCVECIVDGKVVNTISFRKNDHSYIHITLASNLPDGEHTVTLKNKQNGKGTITEFFTT